MDDQGDLALIIDIPNNDLSQMVISMYRPSDTTSALDISMAYLSACDSTTTHSNFSSPLYMALATSSSPNPFVSMPSYLYNMFSTSHHTPVPFLPSSSSASTTSKNLFLGTKPGFDFMHINKVTANVPLTDSTTSSLLGKKKYKPIVWKIRMVTADLPNKFRIERNIIGDPLAEMPPLPINPPSFTLTGCYTTKWWNIIDRADNNNFLWPQEWDLMHHFMGAQNKGFAWDNSKRGTFCKDFSPPV